MIGMITIARLVPLFWYLKRRWWRPPERKYKMPTRSFDNLTYELGTYPEDGILAGYFKLTVAQGTRNFCRNYM